VVKANPDVAILEVLMRLTLKAVNAELARRGHSEGEYLQNYSTPTVTEPSLVRTENVGPPPLIAARTLSR
jgi:hypothetical protein